MKCPNCGNEMVESRAGHLCISCGHIEASTGATVNNGIATGKDGHDQARAAAAAHFEPPKPEPESSNPEPSGPEPSGPESSDTESDAKPEISKPEEAEPADEPEQPVASVAPPWEAPAADAKPDTAEPKIDALKSDDSKPDEPKADEPESDEPEADELKTDKPEAAEPEAGDKPSETPDTETPHAEPPAAETPTPEDLSEVEKAVAQVEHKIEPDEPKEDEPEEVDKKEDDKPESATQPEPEAKPDADESKPSDDTSDTSEPKPSIDGITSPEPKEEPESDKPESEEHSESDKPEDDQPEDSKSEDKPDEPKLNPGSLGESGAINLPVHGPSMPTDASTTPAAPAPSHEPAAPAPDALASDAPAPVASDAPPPSALPLNGKPPLTPVTHPAPFKAGKFAKISAIVLAGLLVLSGGASAAYLYAVSPKQALPTYLERLVKAKTGTFAANLSSTSEGYRVTLKLDGKNDITDATKPKLDLGITGEVSTAKGVVVPVGDAASGSVSGHIVVTDQSLYFKVISLSFLSGLLPANIADNWYKYDLGKTEPGKCVNKGKGAGSYLGSDVLTQIPVKNAVFSGIETVNGAKSLHYRGVIDNTKIKAAVDSVNKNLSADCKINVSADDYKDVSITYDLWRGLSKDRIKLSINDAPSKTTADVTLDTAGYDKPVKIDAPSNAKDISQLLSDMAKVKGASTVLPGQPAAAAPAAPATPAPAADTDTARKANLAAYMDAYKANAVNGFLPTNPPAVSVNVTDPTTGQPYAVGKTKPTALGQIEYRPGGACQGPGITPGKIGSRYLALYTLLADNQTLYCVDNR